MYGSRVSGAEIGSCLDSLSGPISFEKDGFKETDFSDPWLPFPLQELMELIPYLNAVADVDDVRLVLAGAQ